MKVYNNLAELPEFKNAILTIGSYDGVHKGHQKIIERVKQLAQEHNGESVLITFHPHPRLAIYPDDTSLRLLNTIDEKVAWLESYGINHVVVIPFTRDFAAQSPDDYIKNFLLEKFNPKCIVIGYDHRFGKDRVGNIDYLRRYEKNEDFKIIEIERQDIDNIAVSSTKVRRAIEYGEIKAANFLLGHSFGLSGTVIHGQHIGKSIGYPTANLQIANKHKLIPADGIYAVIVDHKDRKYKGMLYIGDRPVLEHHHNKTIEVNIFDFEKEIYGDKLRIEFIEKIRDDIPFKDLDSLKIKLAEDKKNVTKVLQNIKTNPDQKKKRAVTPTVAVVILNYNGQKLLQQFLPSVQKSRYENTKIYVADNGSTDDSIKHLQTFFPEVEIIDLKENHGFAKGYNLALQNIEAEYFVLLNSDVEVRNNWIDPIISLMEKDKAIGACQPKIRSFHNKKTFEHAGAAGGLIDKWGYPFCRGRLFTHVEEDKGQYDHLDNEIFWASGCALFIRAKLFKQLEGFDPDYFAHVEEIDLCWRLKRAGYKVVVEPKSIVYHVGGGTLAYDNPQKTYLNFRNTLYTLLKNEPWSKLYWLILWRLILDGIAALLFLVQGKYKHITAIVKAHRSFFKNYHQLLEKREHYDELIEKVSISQEANRKGIFNRSIIWQYYVRRRKYYKELRM